MICEISRLVLVSQRYTNVHTLHELQNIFTQPFRILLYKRLIKLLVDRKLIVSIRVFIFDNEAVKYSLNSRNISL